MTEIRLTAEQAAILWANGGEIALIAPDGMRLGLATRDPLPFTQAELAEILRRRKEPANVYSTPQVLARLEAIGKLAEGRTMTPDEVTEALRLMDETNPPIERRGPRL